jgi:chemotaxis protein MotB
MSSEVHAEKADDGEFLWLVSLSDLMILLFVFFVVMFSFAAKKLKQADLKQMVAEITNKPAPPNPIIQVGENFKKWVADQKLNQLVDVQRKNDSVVMEIKDQLLFNSGEFSLKQDGVRVAQSLRLLLSKVPPPFKIGIEGHTDDSPLYSSTIRDNWELAGKRALSVFYSLNLDAATQRRIVIMSLGPMDPLVPDRDSHGNAIPQNQAKNRRVTLRIFQ